MRICLFIQWDKFSRLTHIEVWKLTVRNDANAKPATGYLMRVPHPAGSVWSCCRYWCRKWLIAMTSWRIGSIEFTVCSTSTWMISKTIGSTNDSVSEERMLEFARNPMRHSIAWHTGKKSSVRNDAPSKYPWSILSIWNLFLYTGYFSHQIQVSSHYFVKLTLIWVALDCWMHVLQNFGGFSHESYLFWTNLAIDRQVAHAQLIARQWI